MKNIHISHNDNQTIFCACGPACKEYGYECPVWTMYNDGSWSRLFGGKYFRSKPYILPKPRQEYSLNELVDWCYGKRQMNKAEKTYQECLKYIEKSKMS